MSLPVPLRVAIQGERGAFSEEAAIRLLGSSIRVVPTRDSPHMFSSVARHRAHACLAPMENSLVGSIYWHYDLIVQFGFRILAEVYMRVEHCLIAPVGTFLEDVGRVYSHPYALEQCQEFFRRNPRIESVATYDTAGSVQMLIDRREDGAAAIAGRGAARHYGAKILLEGLEDDPDNYTRFFLLGLAGDEDAEPLARSLAEDARAGLKTSLVFYVENEPGGLDAVLRGFADRGIDLSRIESRPVRGRPFEYLFYLDFAGTPAASPGKEAVADLAKRAGFLRILGTYPAGRLDWVGSREPLLPRHAPEASGPTGDRRTGPPDRRTGPPDRRKRGPGEDT